MKSLLLSLLLIPLSTFAQNCSQYSPSNAGVCQCVPSFGSADCSTPVCGSNLFNYKTDRPLAGSDKSVKGCACDDGWSGPGCTVCLTSLACATGYNASGYTPTTSSTSPLHVEQLTNQSLVCNTSPRVYTAGQMSCDVVNPLLQSLFPLSSKLTISRTVDPSLTPIPGVSAVGENGTVFAQLWYDDIETFFCEATSCNQTLAATPSGNSSTWTCQSLACTCRPGTAFCTGTYDLSSTINTLSGELIIDCDASGGTCAFKQTLLQNLFGASGLSLSSCTFGECLSQNNLDLIAGTVALTPPAPNDLSGGVIAGLAVVGVLFLLALLGLIWGFIARSKARSTMPRSSEGKRAGVGVDWTGVGYEIQSSGRKRLGLEEVIWGSKAKSGAGRVEEGRKKGKGGWKTILEGGEGRVEPGKLVAILGPSGAGKSTLVDLLAYRRKSGRTTGNVSFFRSSDEKDGAAQASQASFRPRVGYVDQSDVHSLTSTIRESLLFAARLRLPEYMHDEEKQARVGEVLDQLGLTEVADQRIGDGNRRGISGGEMRRVSIGLELIAKPDVLLLDEPTSGLDSVSAAKVISVLADLAHDATNPTTVIASIHQPSSKLYFAFDQVVLLSLGSQLYFGSGGAAPVDYFIGRGGPVLPSGYNIADYLLEIASGGSPQLFPSSSIPNPAFTNSTPTRRPFVHRATDSHLEKHTTPASDDVDGIALQTLNRTPSHSSSPSSHDDASHARRTPSQTHMIPSKFRPTSKPQASFLTQLSTLCGREWRSLRRDWTLFFAHASVSIVAGVFAGGIYYQVDLTISGFQNRIGSLFFLGSLIAFSSLSALYNLITIRSLFLRERSASYYSPSAWLLSRLLFDVLPLRLVPTIILATITYWMVGLQPHAANFFKYLLILVLYSLGLTLYNFFIAVVIADAGVAVLLSSISNLYFLDPLKYCLEALAVNEVSAGLQIVDTLSGIPVNVNATLIMNLLFGFGNFYYRDVLVLFAFLIGYLVLTILGVLLLLRERR